MFANSEPEFRLHHHSGTNSLCRQHWFLLSLSPAIFIRFYWESISNMYDEKKTSFLKTFIRLFFFLFTFSWKNIERLYKRKRELLLILFIKICECLFLWFVSLNQTKSSIPFLKVLSSLCKHWANIMWSTSLCSNTSTFNAIEFYSVFHSW